MGYRSFTAMAVLDSVRKSMRANRCKDTQPELRLRRELWATGLRGYRHNVKGLPGRPDVAFTRWKIAVFVHGCFWHGCPICESRKNLHPTQNAEFWAQKVRRTRERDAASRTALEAAGWRVLELWEHELKEDLAAVVRTIAAARTAAGA